MESLTLREAAARTSRSMTTLRRYIRSGKLRAEKRPGRFGPEYFVTLADLAAAGLVADSGDSRPVALTRPPNAAPAPAGPGTRARLTADSVPLTLYQELQMKHHQLLVQYGMVRAGGLRALAAQSEVASRQRRIEEQQGQIDALRREAARRTGALEQELREARLELEGRALEIAALEEKVRALEMLTRNAVTNETIDQQFRDLIDQARRVELLTARESRPAVGDPPPAGRTEESPDH